MLGFLMEGRVGGCGWVEFCPHQTLQLIYLIHKLGSVQCCKEKVIRKAYIINRGPPLLECCKILTLLHSDVQPYIVVFNRAHLDQQDLWVLKD